MNEFDLIKSLVDELGDFAPSGVWGPGDDAAVIESLGASKKFLVSKDVLVDGIHFSDATLSARDIGWKALAVNHSDIAASGGEIYGFLVALVLPQDKIEYCKEVYRGFKEYLEEYPAKIIGGDISKGDCLTISVTALGSSKHPISRSGANKGDSLWVSDVLGRSGRGLETLLGGRAPSTQEEKSWIDAHKRPNPRADLAMHLSDLRCVSSMIDISDGLFQELEHLAEQSSVSFTLIEALLPSCVSSGLREQARSLMLGEDYELLFTIPDGKLPDDLIHRYPTLRQIGFVTEKNSSPWSVLSPEGTFTHAEFLTRLELDSLQRGFQHF